MRTRRTRALLPRAGMASLVAALLLPPLAASPASAAEGGGANNVVQVRTTGGHTFGARAHVQATSYGGDSAQSTNLALAQATDCTGCRSRAAALQAVFVTGDPSSVTVTNAAVAANSDCTGCESYAYAFQYVVSPGAPVSLSPQGRTQLLDIQARAAAAVAKDEPLTDLDSELAGLAQELKAVVDAELRAAGTPATTRDVVERDVSKD
jgi:hypothetical protein